VNEGIRRGYTVLFAAMALGQRVGSRDPRWRGVAVVAVLFSLPG